MDENILVFITYIFSIISMNMLLTQSTDSISNFIMLFQNTFHNIFHHIKPIRFLSIVYKIYSLLHLFERKRVRETRFRPISV